MSRKRYLYMNKWGVIMIDGASATIEEFCRLTKNTILSIDTDGTVSGCIHESTEK